MKINENKIKKFTLLAAILAPMIYLFGSLFAQLQGSHGEIVLADKNARASDTYNASNCFVGYYNYTDGSFSSANQKFTTTGLVPVSDIDYVDFLGSPLLSSQRYTAFFDSDEVFLSGGWVRGSDCLNRVAVVANASYLAVSFYTGVSSDTVAYWADYGAVFYYKGHAVTNSEYLFGQFFSRDNFLAASGEKVINGTPDYGFAPAAEMIRYIDSNMLHLANVEWGALVIGYVYYAFHVTIVFLLFELLMFFPHMIENIYERFERGI